MSDQPPPNDHSDASPTDSTLPDGGNSHSQDRDQDQDHDCQQHLEFVNDEWVESAYDDLYVCGICEKEYRMVYLKAFLLDSDDFSLVEEYTDDIEREIEQHRNHTHNKDREAEESANT